MTERTVSRFCLTFIRRKSWQQIHRKETQAYSFLGESRVCRLQWSVPVEVHAPEGAEHGFGVGNGTPAEGWISQAIDFWKRNMK